MTSGKTGINAKARVYPFCIGYHVWHTVDNALASGQRLEPISCRICKSDEDRFVSVYRSRDGQYIKVARSNYRSQI